MALHSSVTTGSQQYVKSGSISSLDANANDITLVGWMQLEDITNWWDHVRIGKADLSRQVYLVGPAGSNKMYLRNYSAAGAQDCNVAVNTAYLNDYEWHYYAIRARKDTSELRLDVDDRSIYATCDPVSYNDISASPTLFISLQSQGSYDNFAAFPSWLSNADVDSLYAAGAGLFYTAYWDAFFSGDPIRFAWSQRPEIRRIY